LGLEFSERRSNNVSGLARSSSTLGALVVENVGTLAEVSMDHTSSISNGDEVVAVGGAGGQLQYFKTNSRYDNGSLKRSITEAIDEVTEPVRLQLERHFEPVEVLPFFTLTYFFFTWFLALTESKEPRPEPLINFLFCQ